ncbi:MAG: hypothetical protein RR951_11095 [Ruthenibacterium sp.]
MNGYMELFQLLMGGYVLFAAVTNSQKLFDFSALQCDNEQRMKHTVRIFYFVIGGVFLLDGGVGMLRYILFEMPDPVLTEATRNFLSARLLQTINLSLMALTLVLIVALVVYVRKHSTRK